MRIPKSIDRILELAEALERHHFRTHIGRAPAEPPLPPPPELKKLRARLLSLAPGILYLIVAAVEIGSFRCHPADLLAVYRSVSDRFSKPIEAVDLLMQHPQYLEKRLHGGLMFLHEEGVDLCRLFEPMPIHRQPPLSY
ncbi:MAG: hypothetical protein HYS12_16565 [Planctomycetes bacterium]|nr:hypothetical protein [Planctomycetota bacterium]